MSTKTTIKRVALVAVAALGFGVLTSVAPATAVTGTYTGSSTLSTSSLTVVAASSGANYMGRFYIDVASGDGTLTHSLPGLYASESISVTTTVAAPVNVTGTAPAVTDLTFQAITAGSATVTDQTAAMIAVGSSSNSSFQIPNAGAATAYDSNNNSYSANYTTGAQNRYWIAVQAGANAIDAGEYTVRVRVVNAENFLIDKTLKIKFVSSIANAGAVLTTAATGSLYVGETCR